MAGRDHAADEQQAVPAQASGPIWKRMGSNGGYMASPQAWDARPVGGQQCAAVCRPALFSRDTGMLRRWRSCGSLWPRRAAGGDGLRFGLAFVIAQELCSSRSDLGQAWPRRGFAFPVAPDEVEKLSAIVFAGEDQLIRRLPQLRATALRSQRYSAGQAAAGLRMIFEHVFIGTGLQRVTTLRSRGPRLGRANSAPRRHRPSRRRPER